MKTVESYRRGSDKDQLKWLILEQAGAPMNVLAAAIGKCSGFVVERMQAPGELT